MNLSDAERREQQRESRGLPAWAWIALAVALAALLGGAVWWASSTLALSARPLRLLW